MKNYFLLLGVCIIISSCSTPEAGLPVRMMGSSSQALLYLNCKAVSEEKIEFSFSRPVTVKSIDFYPNITVESIENGSTVKINLKESFEPGKLITADILAEDEKSNTINVLVTLRTRNNRMPKLEINEVCTEYSNAAAGRKAEFIELKMKSSGNLGGMRLVIIGNSNAAKKTIFEFSPVEVKNGEYAVLHLRTYDSYASKDEYGSNLAESGGINSSLTARDFWMPGTTKLLHKTAFIYILDQDDNVLNAIMLCEKPGDPWPKDYFEEEAKFLFSKKAWISKDGLTCRPSDAIPSTGTTNTRTINRDETVLNTNSPANWYITATSCATPGVENNTKRY
ncbi:MAG: hypothetical protein FWD24_04495 [Treponema sp.]|nr:hypothetical protein [Treponema sp.]